MFAYKKQVIIVATGLLTAFVFGAVGFAAVSGPEQGNPPPLAAVVAQLQETASAEQQAVIDDGRVDLAEYRQAVEAAAACGRARGLTVEVRDTNPPSWEFVAATIAEAEQARNVLTECNATHLSSIVTLWNEQHRPTPQQQAEAVRWVGRCVLDSPGMNPALLSGDATDETILAWLRSGDPALNLATRLCLERVFDEFGVYL